jgi:hypothetical protein
MLDEKETAVKDPAATPLPDVVRDEDGALREEFVERVKQGWRTAPPLLSALSATCTVVDAARRGARSRVRPWSLVGRWPDSDFTALTRSTTTSARKPRRAAAETAAEGVRDLDLTTRSSFSKTCQDEQTEIPRSASREGRCAAAAWNIREFGRPAHAGRVHRRRAA